MSPPEFRYQLLSIGINREANGASIRAAERDAFGISWTFAQLGYWRADRNRCLIGAQATPAALDAHVSHTAEQPDVDLLFIYWSGYIASIDFVVDAIAGHADARLRILIVDTCDAGDRVRRLDARLQELPGTQRPVVLASCAPDGRARENSLHGFFTGALLKQLRRPRRPGTRSLNLLDAFNRAADEAVPRVGPPIFTTNGSGRLRIPILAQGALPFESQSPIPHP
jgi:hypothetical protein